MRFLALAWIAALPQDPPAEGPPAWRRPLTMVNRQDDALPAGVQVSLFMPRRGGDAGDASDVAVYHGEKRLASWSRHREVWFRTAAPIPAGGRDADYHVRYGGAKVTPRPDEVFEFFEGFAGASLDPARWTWDPDLGFHVKDGGLEVTEIPAGRSEFAPASLIPRLSPMPADFVFEVDLRWEVDPKAAFSFAVRAELAPGEAPNAETRARAAALAAKLDEDDVEAREEATRALVKMGAGAVPALEEAAHSKSPEVRQRAANVLSRIWELESPPAIRTGLSTGDSPEGWLDRADLLGRSRSLVKRVFPPRAGETLSIARGADGETLLPWTRRPSARVPGTATRLRIDFWGPAGARPGSIRIARVAVRRFVETPPAADLGRESAIR